MRFGHENRGFALITVLLLMGFLVGLVLGITVLLRIDFQLVENTSDIKKAKANARFGLYEALGELQQKLGLDKCITVPAEFFPSGCAEDENWKGRIGVFDVSDSSFKGAIGGLKKKIVDHKGGIGGFYGYSIEDIGLAEDFRGSLGVLSHFGGLKKDISSYLSIKDSHSVIKDNTGIFEDSTIKKDDDYVPKWGFVRDFYQLAKSYNKQSGSLNKLMVPKGFPDYNTDVFHPDFDNLGNGWTTPSNYGFGPVIVGCSFGFSPEFEKDQDGNFRKRANIRYFVTVALWNPYDFSLEMEDYSFLIEPKGGGKIALDRMPSKEFKFKGSIKHCFAPGEVGLFSLFSGGGKADDDHYNLLKSHNSSLGYVVQEQVISASNQREERRFRGGRRSSSNATSQDNRLNSLHSVSWGDGKPIFSLLFLSKDEKHLYQEVHRLKLEKNPFSKEVEAIETISTRPLFAIIFKNAVCSSGRGRKDYLENYNLRAPVVCPTRNMKLANNPYQLNTFVEGGSSNKMSWKFDVKDFPRSSYNAIFSMPEKFESLGFLRHINFGALERHAAFPFGNSFSHCGIPRNSISPKDDELNKTYFYDYSYKLNENLWDDYFLSGKIDYPKEVFEKNYLRLKNASDEMLLDVNKCAGGILLKEAFNVNSTSVTAWKALLSEIEEVSKADIERLALAVVKEVKRRGPFCSLGSFINRCLEDSDLGNCGTLQAALNEAQIDKTQGELLEVIGHKLAVRSDSFIVRAYGEACHPFSGEIKARVCCEALVQRVPEYLEANENCSEDKSERLSPINKQFGRRFKVISFRWANFE